jgi:hypothetical protein
MRQAWGVKPGEIVADTYRLERRLGAGGMGEVFGATDLRLGKSVAVKLLPPGLLPASALSRFAREAELAARADRHAGVVRVHASGTHQGRAFLVMELVEGEDLGALFLRGPVEPARLAEIARSLAETLAACHAEGIVHRDLKPGNVLLPADGGRPCLTDFGLAVSADSERLTRTGELIGTPSYMAPEQAMDGARAIGPAVDVYALGALLHHGLTGQPPFAGPLLKVLSEVVHQGPRAPRAANPQADPGLEAICLRAMAREPTDRIPSAEAFVEALDAWASGEPPPARRLGQTAGAVALALLALGGAWLLGAGSGDSGEDVLAAHQAWEAELLVACAKQPNPPPFDPIELRRRADALPASGIDAATLDALRARLAALATLGAPDQTGRLPTLGTSAPARFVAALLHEARGEHRLALARLTEGDGPPPGSVPLASRLVATQLLELTTPSQAGRSRLATLASQAEAAAVGSAGFARLRVQALDANAQAWEQALLEALANEREDAFLRDLEALALPPAEGSPRVGPRLRAVLGRGLETLVEQVRVEELQRAPEPLRRAMSYQARRLELDPGARVPPRLTRYASSGWGLAVFTGMQSFAPVIVSLRNGILADEGGSLDELARYVRAEGVDLGALDRERQSTRALEFALVLEPPRDEPDPTLQAVRFSARGVLQAPVRDLGGPFLGEVLVNLNHTEVTLLVTAPGRDRAHPKHERWRSRWEEAWVHNRAARRLNFQAKHRQRLDHLEDMLLAARGLEQLRLDLWKAAVAWQQDAVQGRPRGPFRRRPQVEEQRKHRRGYLANAHAQLLDAYVRNGLHDEVVRHHEEACRLTHTGNNAPAGIQSAARTLLAAEDPRSRALLDALLEVTPRRLLATPDLARAWVYSALERGEVAVAQARLEDVRAACLRHAQDRAAARRAPVREDEVHPPLLDELEGRVEEATR